MLSESAEAERARVVQEAADPMADRSVKRLALRRRHGAVGDQQELRAPGSDEQRGKLVLRPAGRRVRNIRQRPPGLHLAPERGEVRPQVLRGGVEEGGSRRAVEV